tara:strand:- start:11247 stop:11963 length:717 start_codon:yes stop_codon:yes gene_type:complete
MSKKETITIEKDTLWKVGFFVVLFLFGFSLIGGFGFTGKDVGSNGNGPAPTLNNPQAAIKISADNSDPIAGSPDASITVYEFSDFQCPFCARAASQTVSELKSSSLFKNGEINFVYRHFPLTSIHPYAQKSAEASECANRQGKFWEYHDELFANQGSLDVASLKSYAISVGLDSAKFNSCLDGSKAASKVSDDLKSAVAAGGRGTPYFVIYNFDNGKAASVSGAVPFSQIEQAILDVR